jgi:hypothetical protein
MKAIYTSEMLADFQWATWCCIWEVLSLNPCQDILTEVFMLFLSPSRQVLGWYLSYAMTTSF